MRRSGCTGPSGCRTAWNSWPRKPPGLVLLDLSLPDSHGLETFAKVYAHSPKVPIIVLTGNDDQTVALSAVKAGAQDYLVKGKLDRELLDALDALLDRAQALPGADSSTRPTTTRSPGCRTAACCTTA